MKNNQHIPALRFNRLTSAYDWIVSHTMPEQEFKTELITQAGFKDTDIVLDFGVGTATLSILIKQKYPNIQITGIDVDKKILSLARAKIESKGLDIDLIQYDGCELPFTNKSFCKVITSLVFHHLSKEQKIVAVAEIYRILEINGELLIADWGKPSNLGLRLLAYLLQVFDGFGNTRDNINGYLPQLIKGTGFNVRVLNRYNTIFGTLYLYKAVKSL